jgi:hypothetical protein
LSSCPAYRFRFTFYHYVLRYERYDWRNGLSRYNMIYDLQKSPCSNRSLCILIALPDRESDRTPCLRLDGMILWLYGSGCETDESGC